jgi:hypothetical protein
VIFRCSRGGSCACVPIVQRQRHVPPSCCSARSAPSRCRSPRRACAAAGTYALLQPELSSRLRAAKLDNLHRASPDLILSANVGCLAHLETGTAIPVRHWIEWLDERLRPGEG